MQYLFCILFALKQPISAVFHRKYGYFEILLKPVKSHPGNANILSISVKKQHNFGIPAVELVFVGRTIIDRWLEETIFVLNLVFALILQLRVCGGVRHEETRDVLRLGIDTFSLIVPREEDQLAREILDAV
jgi:hypothetical protein